MAHQVCWTERVLNEFIVKASLTEEEVFIMKTRVKGWSVTKQATELNKSESSIHRSIALLKKKYDNVQAEYPEVFPPRRFSAKETYMDTH